MRAVIVLGGDLPSADLLRRCAEDADFTIAADRGLEAFDIASLVPDFMVGDMDSVKPAVLSRFEPYVEERRLPCEKDDTDGFEAMHAAVSRGADDITILGALGGRLDHALANLMILVRAAELGARAELLDEQVRIERVNGKLTLSGQIGDTVSVLPLGRVEHITLSGFYYPLVDGTMTSASSLGISNVMTTERAEVTVGPGDLFVFHWYGKNRKKP